MGVCAVHLYSGIVFSGRPQVQFCVYHLHFTMGCYDSVDQIISSSLREVRAA